MTWDLANLVSGSYHPETVTEQAFEVKGTISLPEEIANTGSIPLEVIIAVTVSEAGFTGIPTASPAAGFRESASRFLLHRRSKDLLYLRRQ